MGIDDFLGLVEQQVSTELVDEPYQLAGVLRTLGLIHLGFDDATRARSAIEEAHRVQADGFKRGEVTAAQFAETEFALARVQFNLQEFALAEATYRRALASREKALGREDVDTVETMRHLASALRAQQRLDESQAMLEDAIGRSAAFPDTNAANVIRVGLLHGRATLLAAREDVVAAVAQYEQALNALIEIVPRDDWRVGRTRYNLARVQMRTGDLKRAFENARESEKILHEKKGADATMTLESASLLAAIRAMAAQSGVSLEESASLNSGDTRPGDTRPGETRPGETTPALNDGGG
jgi:tetratricopeptide (TPR) repeat protein